MSYNGSGPNINRLKQIATVTMRRGPHAFGWAWIDGRGRLRMYKRHGRIVDHLDKIDMLADARMIIGHCRYATHGDLSNLNNHPHPCDGGWVAHNGVIGRYERLFWESGAHAITDCDSEALCMLIENSEKESLLERCYDAVDIAAESPLAMAGLWSRPSRLIVLRAGNPLSVGVCSSNKRIYFGSLRDGLPGKVSEVEDGGGVSFGPKDWSAIKPVKPANETPAPNWQPLFPERPTVIPEEWRKMRDKHKERKVKQHGWF